MQNKQYNKERVHHKDTLQDIENILLGIISKNILQHHGDLVKW